MKGFLDIIAMIMNGDRAVLCLFYFCLEALPRSTQVLFLALCSGIISRGFMGSCVVSGIKSESALHKASVLLTVQSVLALDSEY